MAIVVEPGAKRLAEPEQGSARLAEPTNQKGGSFPSMQTISFSKKLMWLQIPWRQQLVSLNRVQPDLISRPVRREEVSLHANYFLFQKVDMAANTMATAASESEQLVTAGLQICLQFDRVGVRGVEVCVQTQAK